MSDDFGDDEFLMDDLFLREVDNITARASTTTASGTKEWTGALQNAASSSRPGPARLSAGPESKSMPRAPIPRSPDDFDDVPLPPESLLAFHTPSTARPASKPTPNLIPSSRLGLGLGRSSSSSDTFMQTHLNFRRENQSTKGKRWDRTIFAETGRRIGAVTGKGGYRARAWVREDDDDDDLDEEEDDLEPLVPGPKPLIDTNAPYEPQRHVANASTVGTYIYPTNRPKREYQYDIVRACFTDNCLVALPTGLGKTFVAGVVMLNYYRWFPTGKIVFLAPTKPLVNQQIEACQMTCGIPSASAAVMTGQSVSAKERARLWDERRVFYCTPQTLDNDLKNGSVDPKDIVLAVFDEAHKASGSYAYTTILAYITAQHPFFRVLALTATPGADVPRVQAVVDALHISRIEIREAEAPEIRKYMNEKRTEKHSVPMGEVIEGFRDRWAALMRPYVVKLVDKDILTERDLDIKKLKPFRLTAKRMDIARDRNSGLKWSFGSLQSLEKMARAMGNLLEFSIGMFHTTLTEIAGNSTTQGKKATSKGNSNSIRNNFEFQKLLRDVEAELNSIRIGQGGKTKADRHPKMVKTLELLLGHFSQAADDEKTGTKNDTRAMVFCSFRECVLEVVDMLNEYSGLIRATKFVGQSQGKQEVDKGFNQKEQKRTIAEFKEGKYNTLVSTSIGEEGLDIGEVDFVIIYDMPKQSIKLLQRIGRTGRKRDGKVHVLMSEGREDANWNIAQQTHQEIQEEILHSRNLELFEDVERLLPPGELPDCVEEEMPVDPWDPENRRTKRRLPAAEKATGEDKDKEGMRSKRKRGHEVPRGGHEGFKSVAELLRDCGKLSKGKKAGATLSAGAGGAEGRRGKSSGRGRKRQPSPIRSESDESEEVEDLELLCGSLDQAKSAIKISTKKTATKTTKTSRAKKARTIDRPLYKEEIEDEETRRLREEREELNRSALDFFNAQGPARKKEDTLPLATPPSSPPLHRSIAAHPPLSPDDSPPPLQPSPNSREIDKAKLSPRTAAAAGFSQVDAIDLSWDEDISLASPQAHIAMMDSTPAPSGNVRPRIMGLSRGKGSASTSGKSTAMAPPAVPHHATSSSPLNPHKTTPILESTQFPIRRAGRRRLVIPPSSEEKMISEQGVGKGVGSTPGDSPFIPAGRLRRRLDSSPVAQRRGKATHRSMNDNVKAYLDLDVEVSGSEGSADESWTDEETESDRRFGGLEFAPTQARRGYNQRAIYVAGLSTQAAPRAGLAFKPQGDKVAFMAKARKPVLVTDDEDDEVDGGEGSENEYELGSFVCNDEDVDHASE